MDEVAVLCVEGVRAFRYRMPLKRAYGTSRGRTTSSVNFVVGVDARGVGGTITGWGECQPRHVLTGDGEKDRSSAWLFLQRALESVQGIEVRAGTPDEGIHSVRTVMARLADIASREAAAIHGDRPFRGTLLGVEVALLDVVSQSLGLRLSELLGEKRKDVSVSISTISSTTALADVARKVAAQKRFPMTRLKGDKDVQQSLSLLETAAKANTEAGQIKPLWIDLNEALNFERATVFINAAVERMASGVLPDRLTIEGPLPKADGVLHAELQRVADKVAASYSAVRELTVEIMPDESMWDVEDLHALNEQGGCRAINIKAPKAGGLLASLDLANAAVAANPDIRICIGGMLGTSELTAWALHNLARAMPRIDYVTTVPPRNVEPIAFPQSRYTSTGSSLIAAQQVPGLGATPNMEKLAPYLQDQFRVGSAISDAHSSAEPTKSAAYILGEEEHGETSSTTTAATAKERGTDRGRMTQHKGKSEQRESRRLLIQGAAVQNVGYREWLRRTANQLGVSGWVRNRGDGAVEALIRGRVVDLQRIVEKSQSGPYGALIGSVVTTQSEIIPHAGFRIRETSTVPTGESLGLRSKTVRLVRRAVSAVKSARPDRGATNLQGAISDSSAITAGSLKSAMDHVLTSDAILKKRLTQLLKPSTMAKLDEAELDELRDVLKHAGPPHVSYMTLRRIERSGLSVGRAVSFRAKLVEASELRQYGPLRYLWKLDNKAAAYSLVDRLGISRPNTTGGPSSFDEIAEEYPRAVKNTRGTGSRGCYLVYSPDNIVHVYDGTRLDSWRSMREHAARLMDSITPGHTLRDQWISEELIFDPADPSRSAPDIKFYSFYGDIRIVLEMRRDRGREYSFATADNIPFDPGIRVKTFQGNGVTPAEIEMIRTISRSIPYPFVRIDMLRGANGLVFGEFTPRTGQFDEFSPEVDRTLGEAWSQAESRIVMDLLRGKEFRAFNEATGVNSGSDGGSSTTTAMRAPSANICREKRDVLPGFSLAQIGELLGGRWSGPYDPSAQPTGVNSRIQRISPGDLAILMDSPDWSDSRRELSRQDRYTAEELLDKAQRDGALAAVSSMRVDNPPLPVLSVANSHEALKTLGFASRKGFTGDVVGITGTVGKSTTKDAIDHVLSDSMRVVATPGNWNMWESVAETLTGLWSDPDAAVIEATIHAFDDRHIEHAGSMIRPTVGVITAIGTAHRDVAKTVADTARIKGRLLEGLVPGGQAVLHRDSPQFDTLYEVARKAGASTIASFGTDAASEYRLIDWNIEGDGSRIRVSVHGKEMDYRLAAAGRGLALNTLCALAVTHEMGVSLDAFVESIAGFSPAARVATRHILPVGSGDVLLVDDSTNATFLSMVSSFELMQKLSEGRHGQKVAVLGQINFLGGATGRVHASLAGPLLEAGVDTVLTTGRDMDGLRDALGPTVYRGHADTPEELAELAWRYIGPGDTVLVKGSSKNTGFRKVARSIIAAANSMR